MYFCKYTWSEILSFHLRTPWFCDQQEHLQLWCSKFKPRFGFKVHLDDELKDDNHQLMRKSWQNIVTAKVTFLWRHKTWCCMTWRHMRMKDVIWCCMTWRHMRIEDVTWCCVTWRHGTYKRCDVVWRDVTWVWMMWCCMTWRHVTMNDVMLCDVTSCDYERSVMMLCIVMLSDIPPTVYQIKLMYLIASSFLTPKLYWVNCNGILIKCLFNYTCLSDFT